MTRSGGVVALGECMAALNLTGGDQAVLGYAADVFNTATWTMMIMGFGAAGSLLRRRRVVAA